MSNLKLNRMVQNRNGTLAISQDGMYDTHCAEADSTFAPISNTSGRVSKSRSRNQLIRRISSQSGGRSSSSADLFEADLTTGFGPLRSNHNSFLNSNQRNSFVVSSSPSARMEMMIMNGGTSSYLLDTALTEVSRDRSCLSRVNEWAEESADGSDGLLLKIDRRGSTENSSDGSEVGAYSGKNKRRLSEVILSSWFFQRRRSDVDGNDDDDDNRDSRSDALPANLQPPRENKSISKLISGKFSAAKDFRSLNFFAPQSM